MRYPLAELDYVLSATSGTVKYVSGQTLTDAEKAQARTNIGAAQKEVIVDIPNDAISEGRVLAIDTGIKCHYDVATGKFVADETALSAIKIYAANAPNANNLDLLVTVETTNSGNSNYIYGNVTGPDVGPFPNFNYYGTDLYPALFWGSNKNILIYLPLDEWLNKFIVKGEFYSAYTLNAIQWYDGQDLITGLGVETVYGLMDETLDGMVTKLENEMVFVSGTGHNSAILKNTYSSAIGNCSVAEGYKTTTMGEHSHAEGSSVTSAASRGITTGPGPGAP